MGDESQHSLTRLARSAPNGIRTVLLGVVVALLVSAPVQAAFPGENGRIAFTTWPSPGGQIEAIEPDGTGRIVLGAGSGPAWSADATKIAFVDRSSLGRPEIFTMSADGSNRVQVTREAPPGLRAPTAWAPDGGRIAFASGSCGMGYCYYGLYVTTSDGSAVTGAGQGIDPAWSPDGKRIAYQFYPPTGEGTAIYLVDPNGSNHTRFIEGVEPDWSPDGSRLAFAWWGDGNGEIYTVNVDGTGLQRITDNPAIDRAPAWSPDGKEIAFLTDRDGNYEIYTMNSDGTEPFNVTRSAGDEVGPDWQPIANGPPDCGAVTATPGQLWPPNHRFRTVSLDGASDPDGDEVTIAIGGVTQDEPVGRRPDAREGESSNEVELRAQRRPHGDGRVYRVSFTASDGSDECSGVTTVEVRRHKNRPALDSAPPSYNSFG